MHRSRLYALIIDTPTAEAEASAGFWAAALGADARPVPDEPEFTGLAGAFPGLTTAVQAVDDAPRYHLDIETDDVAAEVARLTALGAVLVSRRLDCHTLRAPGGHLVCVVPVESDHELFVAGSQTWA
jgi:glyoxalase superfamily protein